MVIDSPNFWKSLISLMTQGQNALQELQKSVSYQTSDRICQTNAINWNVSLAWTAPPSRLNAIITRPLDPIIQSNAHDFANIFIVIHAPSRRAGHSLWARVMRKMEGWTSQPWPLAWRAQMMPLTPLAPPHAFTAINLLDPTLETSLAHFHSRFVSCRHFVWRWR